MSNALYLLTARLVIFGSPWLEVDMSTETCRISHHGAARHLSDVPGHFSETPAWPSGSLAATDTETLVNARFDRMIDGRRTYYRVEQEWTANTRRHPLVFTAPLLVPGSRARTPRLFEPRSLWLFFESCQISAQDLHKLFPVFPHPEAFYFRPAPYDSNQVSTGPEGICLVLAEWATWKGEPQKEVLGAFSACIDSKPDAIISFWSESSEP